MPLLGKGSADFADLGDIEFSALSHIREFGETGRNVAAQSAMIVGQAATDLYNALLTIPPAGVERGLIGQVYNSPHRKAVRVRRHLDRARDSLEAVQASMAKLPHVFLVAYAEELHALRNPRSRRTFDLGA